MRHAMRLSVAGLGISLLAACTTSSPPPVATIAPPPPRVEASLTAAALRPYPVTDQFQQCVPFARAVSGVELYGDAWSWWPQAAGRYDRGKRPEVGAVLVLPKAGRLKYGHVAVVHQLQSDPRMILVTHANWGSDGNTRGVVHERQPVMDVSPNNDWSMVRMWNTKGEFGSPYAAHGFIYNRVGLQEARAN